MKTVIIFDSGNKDEIELLRYLEECNINSDDCNKFDINTKEPMHILFGKLQGENADLIISINANAFSFVTELGNCSLNSLPSKVIHLIESKAALAKIPPHTILSLSHYVVIKHEFENEFRENNPDISNVSGYTDNPAECMRFAMKELWL